MFVLMHRLTPPLDRAVIGSALCCLLAAPFARAEETPMADAPSAAAPIDGVSTTIGPARTYVNFRVGAATTAARPELCLDLAPLDFLSIEACGTGSGFLHHDPAPETAHFRAHFRPHRWLTPIGQLEPLLGLGFAEIQVGEDAPGFQFRGVGPNGVETAGPEATLGLRLLYPVGGGFELVGNATLGLLYAPHAPELIAPQAPLQPFGSLTFGLGF